MEAWMLGRLYWCKGFILDVEEMGRINVLGKHEMTFG